MITQEGLKQVLNYDPTTGIFTWLISSGTAKVGKIAGCKDKEGYIKIRYKGRGYRANRLAFFYMTNSISSEVIDHIDGKVDNNTFTNLREATQQQNQFNRKGVSGSKSGVKGAHLTSTGKYRATIRVNGKKTHIGMFDTAEEASKAYNNIAKQIHKGFYNDTRN